jgi:UDP-glucose 4-epimerase
MLTGKTILITGGTGSFGKAMLNELLGEDCAAIRIFSRDEEKQDAMRGLITDPRVKYYIGDVRDRLSVDAAMVGVDLVFHAAALKQVPSCEFFPLEALRTNALGSANVLESAIARGVQSVVCLSTDKAVSPINAMGITKALMEKIAQSYARRIATSGGGTTISIVRYGNVMYSRGSVIPLFVRQIRDGKPLTVTEPAMTRFMLSLTDAVGLVKFAFAHADHGDIFIRKAPACTIADLVQALKSLFKADNDVRIIGMRHGEKLYETLARREELRGADDLGDFYRLRMDVRDLRYQVYFSEGDTGQAALDDYHSHNAERLSLPEVEQLLLSLPEIRAELARG